MNPLSVLFKYKDYIKYASKISLFSRYSNMYLGIIWWFLDPVLLMAIYGFVYLVVFQSRTEDYLIFLIIGIIVWRWMSSTTISSSSSISGKISILEQVAAPKQVFPMVTLVVETLLFMVGFILIFIAMIIDAIPLTWHVLEVVPISIMVFISLYGVALIVAHYGAFVADLRPALAYGIRLLFYLSPIFYEVTILPERIQQIYSYNPITIILESYRSVLIYGESPDYLGLAVIFLIGLAFISAGLKLIRET